MPDSASEAPSTRLEQARALVRRNVYWTLGIGLVPVPVVDFVGVTAIQIKMMKGLADLYGVQFHEQRAQVAVWSLIAGTGSVSVAGLAAHSLFKLVPGLGLLVGTVGTSLLAGALTQAVGNLFVMHYEAGGTLLTFDAAAMRSHFREELKQARETVKTMQADPKEPIAP